MQAAWLAFACTGVPDIRTDEVTATWPQYDAASLKTMLFGKDITVVEAPKERQRAVWDEVHAAFMALIDGRMPSSVSEKSDASFK